MAARLLNEPTDPRIPGHTHEGVTRYSDGTCETCDWCENTGTFAEINVDGECTACGEEVAG